MHTPPHSGPPRTGPDHPLSLEIDVLQKRLIVAERANAELLRLTRISRTQGGWRLPIAVVILLFAFIGGTLAGRAYSERNREPPRLLIE